jgi:hypothetical protein
MFESLGESYMKPQRVSKKMTKHVMGNVAMVAKKASEAYNKLPRHTRNWIERQDFIQDGLIEAMTTVARRYDPAKGTAFSTYLFKGLDLFYKNLLEPHFADMRYEGRTASIEDLAPGWERRVSPETQYQGDSAPVVTGSWNRQFSTEECFVGTHFESTPDLEDLTDKQHKAERELVKLCTAASPQLRVMLIKWFIQPTETKFHTAGKRFESVREEFVGLCKQYNITKDVCLVAMQSQRAKTQLASVLAR